VKYLVLARVLENGNELDRYRTAVPGAEIVVCGLVATEATRRERLLKRMPPGASRDWHLARSAELEPILERFELADFVVVNDGRSVREVALEVLERAGWPRA
jgi:dephospho-CoA kinase